MMKFNIFDHSDNHEVRFASGLMMLFSMMLGTIDALAPNDTVKAFGWLFMSIIFNALIFYELLWFDSPISKVKKYALLLTSVYFGSLWGIWNFTWLFFTYMLVGFGFIVNGRVGIFPNLSLSLPVWIITSILACVLVVISHYYIGKLSESDVYDSSEI